MEKKKGESTRCVHNQGYNPENYRGALTPVFTATAYEYVGVDKYVYPRYFNTPNITVVENQMADLEHAEAAMLFSSGMAATMTVFLSQVRNGDHIILQKDIYGGTYDAVKVEMDKIGVSYSFVGNSPNDFEKAIRPNTKLIFFESPSNPLLNLTDIKKVAEVAKKHNVLTVFDNTFASPINQNPHSFGIDITIQSGTKYLGGHSDICCGIATMSKLLEPSIRETGIHLGGNLDPQTASLLERSLKTLSLRVERQTENAMKIAQWLDSCAQITKVYYPGLSSNPGHKTASEQMKGYGAMLSFEVKGDPDEFVKKLKIIKPLMSLGSVETTITSPVQTSHARMPEEERKELGITTKLLRLSTGIENAEDLISDIEQALI